MAKPPLGPIEGRKAGKVKGLLGRREHAVGVLKVAAQAGQVTVAELEHWRLEGGGKVFNIAPGKVPWKAEGLPVQPRQGSGLPLVSL